MAIAAKPTPCYPRERFQIMRRTHKFLSALLSLGALMSCDAAEPATTLKYFRSDMGVSAGAGPLPDKFDSAEALRWRVAIDPGHSTPILHEGKIFLTTYRADS